MSSSLLPPPSPTESQIRNFSRDSDDEDADTASQRSISLSSPPRSKHSSLTSDPRQSFASQSSGSNSNRKSDLFTDFQSDIDVASTAFGTGKVQETPASSVAPSPPGDDAREFKPVTYPPSPPNRDDTMSISSFASTSSRKARPESLLINPTNDPIILGVALVDFNHLVCFIACINP